MKRLLLALALTAIGAMALRWWTGPDPAWACGPESTSGCASVVELDVTDLDLVEPSLSREGLALSPDGTEIAIGLRTLTEVGPIAGAVAIFDATTGDPIQILRSVSGDDASVARVIYSPDGSLVAALIGDGTSSRVEVFDAGSGAAIASLFAIDGPAVGRVCQRRLGISPDNTELQCNNQLASIETGADVGRAPDGRGYADFAALNSARSRQDLWVEVRSDFLEIDPPEPQQRFALSEPTFGLSSRLRFAPDGARLVHVIDLGDQGLPIGGPRRSRPEGHLRVVDVSDGEESLSVETGERFVDAAWSEDGRRFALATSDLVVAVFEAP